MTELECEAEAKRKQSGSKAEAKRVSSCCMPSQYVIGLKSCDAADTPALSSTTDSLVVRRVYNITSYIISVCFYAMLHAATWFLMIVCRRCQSSYDLMDNPNDCVMDHRHPIVFP
jgi:hypothetical protein